MITTLTNITAFWVNTLGCMCILGLAMCTVNAIHRVFIPCCKRRCGRRISSDLSSNSQDVQKHAVGHSSSRGGLLLVRYVRNIRRHPKFNHNK